MAETIVLKVRLEDATEKDPQSLNNTPKKQSTENIMNGHTTESLSAKELKEGKGLVGGTYRGLVNRRMSQNFAKGSDDYLLANQMAKKSFSNARTSMRKYVSNGTKALAMGVSAFGYYSDYMQTGDSLSGAKHSADIHGRTNQAIGFGASLAIATAINPALAPIVLATKAYQHSQQTRQELYKIRSSQITSNITKDLLVKNTMERRF